MPLILFSIQSQSMSTRGPTLSVYLLTHILLLTAVFHLVRDFLNISIFYCSPPGPTLIKKIILKGHFQFSNLFEVSLKSKGNSLQKMRPGEKMNVKNAHLYTEV